MTPSNATPIIVSPTPPTTPINNQNLQLQPQHQVVLTANKHPFHPFAHPIHHPVIVPSTNNNMSSAASGSYGSQTNGGGSQQSSYKYNNPSAAATTTTTYHITPKLKIQPSAAVPANPQQPGMPDMTQAAVLAAIYQQPPILTQASFVNSIPTVTVAANMNSQFELQKFSPY